MTTPATELDTRKANLGIHQSLMLLTLALIPSQAALAANDLKADLLPGVAVVDDHPAEFAGRQELACNAGATLAASSEIYGVVVAYYNPNVGKVLVVVVDGEAALSSAGAELPSDDDIAAALPSADYPFTVGPVIKFSTDGGSAVTIDGIWNHKYRTIGAFQAAKDAVSASCIESDVVGADAQVYRYRSTIQFEIDAADIAAADLITDFPLPPIYGKLLNLRATCTSAVTTGAKAADVDLHIGATPVTGGQVALAGLYALGEVEAGAAITALNTFTPATAVASLVGSAVTAFIEGRFNFAVDVYELVTA